MTSPYHLQYCKMSLTGHLILLFNLLIITFSTAGGKVKYDPTPNPKAIVVLPDARFTLLTPRLIRMEWGGQRDGATLAFINRNLQEPYFTVTEDADWTVISLQSFKITVRYRSDNSTFSANNLEVTMRVFRNNNYSTITWKPSAGIHDIKQRLPGTIRSLDRVNGAAELNCYKQSDPDTFCNLGLVSRDGYVIVDDTNQPMLDDSEWPWVVNDSTSPPDPSICQAIPAMERQECGYLNIPEYDCTGHHCCYDNSTTDNIPSCYYTMKSYRDLYFFAHDHSYSAALRDFTSVSGPIPLPPRYAFGVFYSRYHAYNDMEITDIVSEFEEHEIPLDVVVLDMDWHITFYDGTKDSFGEVKGWTGYTWDKHLFPYPRGFINELKRKGLKITLNVHAASGIQPWEDTYREMAISMGVDPNTMQPIPFDPANKTFVTNWCKIVLAAREAEGVDFWWLDWAEKHDRQKWMMIPRTNPTFWQNHIFFTNPYHWNDTLRPFILHRWGGLGSHRYQAGFSGDVIWSWDSLTFQVYFTLSATNVAHGYWSHDIGGHISPGGPGSLETLDGELYTRWVQWGIFSPIFRPHTNKNGREYRRIWKYPDVYYKPMRQAILFRQSLIPYIYTAAYSAYFSGVSIIRPMYYEFPESEEAYTYQTQYFFGEDLLISPITEPLDNITQMATKKIWIPDGCYISWMDGEVIKGSQVIERKFTLSEIPLYVKCGIIIPMTVDYSIKKGMLGSAKELPEVLKVMVFHMNVPWNNRDINIYEDDGNSTEYMDRKYAQTAFSYGINSGSISVGITSVIGEDFSGKPQSRSYQICIANSWPAKTVTFSERDQLLPYAPLEERFSQYSSDCWTYDGSRQLLIINLVTKIPTSEGVVIIVDFSPYVEYDPFWLPSGYPKKLARLQKAKEILDAQWNDDTVHQSDYPSLLNASAIGKRITYHPENIVQLTQEFATFLKSVIPEVTDLKLQDDVKKQVLALLED